MEGKEFLLKFNADGETFDSGVLDSRLCPAIPVGRTEDGRVDSHAPVRRFRTSSQSLVGEQ
jgi:hypothetical protein